MNAAMRFDRKKALNAVARRAFGGAIDVRPLLPKYEREIGKMMAESVPASLRNPAIRFGTQGGEKNRQERISRLAAIKAFVEAGMTAEQIALARGVTRNTAVAWMRQVAEMPELNQ